MRAVVRDSYGSPDVLRVEDVPAPDMASGEVLVRVHASSVNDYDWHLLTGHPFVNRVVAPWRPKHRILGCDVAGTVSAVGDAVTGFRPGDRVYGDMCTAGLGAFAEYVAAPASSFAFIPGSLTFEQAAAVPEAGGLAMLGMRARRLVGPGDDVLINGGGGGVGTIAIQTAKSLGSHVTGVDAAHKLATMTAVGADRVVDYRVEDVLREGRTYDLVLDVAAYRPMSAYLRLLKPGGYAALIGGSVPRLFATMAFGPVRSRLSDRAVGVPLWRPNNASDVAYLGALLESGAVSPVIDSVHPLEHVADAMRRFGAQQHTGKIVITV